MRNTVNFYSMVEYDEHPPEKCPWIQIEGDDTVINPDVKVDSSERIQIRFDYPLGVPVTFAFKHEDGFTRGDFLTAVREGYREIYNAEAQTSSIPEGRASPELLNRNRTDGAYNIWRHDIGDLSLDRAIKKDGVWHLEVSS